MSVTGSLVGRSAELRVLEDALARLDGGRAQAVELVGPAGIGKTRLLAALGERAESRGHLVLFGSGAELERELPFWVFVDALDEYLEGLEPRRLARLGADTRGELAKLLPSFSRAAGPPSGTLHERYRTHRAVRELLEHLAATRPLVLALDDFQWADSASIDLVVALLHRPPAARVLLALGSRRRQLPAPLATALERALRAGTLARVELGPLTREQTGELLGRGGDDPLTAAFYEETGGNPFYLEQLARAPGRWLDAAPWGPDVLLAGVAVPPMVAAALAEELAMLSVSVRSVLDGASVAGDPFELDLAAIAAAAPEPAARDAVDVLLRLDLVRSTDMPRRFRFRHPIVRRAVYEATAGGWRLGAHERIAQRLAERGAGAAVRAHHVERSARHGDATAIAVLREAGEQSAPRAPATAARWFRAALQLLPETAPARERVELLLARAQALAATGRFRESHSTLLESIAIVSADSLALRGQLAATCARVEHLLGQHEQAHDRLLRALEEVPDQASPEAVSLMIELAMDGAHRLDYKGMADWGARATDAARQLGDPVLQATAVAAYARAAAFVAATQQAEVACTEAAALVDALSDDELARRLDAAVHLASAEFYFHRFDAGSGHAERALAIGRATGQGQLFPLIYAVLGMIWCGQGRLAEAVELLDGAIEAARTTGGNTQTLAWSLYARSTVALAAGDVETALATGQEAFDVTDDGKPSHTAGAAARGLAAALLEVGNAEQAAELLERSGGGTDMPRSAPSWRSSVLELLTRCRLALGQVDEARRAAECAAAAANVVNLPLAKAYADRAAAAVALETADPARAAELALAAATVADAVGIPMEAALARTLAGRALAQHGDRDRAVEQLQRAASTLDLCGAQRYRDAAERELRRLGHQIHRRAQPSNPDSAGVESLTKRELEIARLVVDRQTNREIAKMLFVSPRTVETHIRNISHKLNANSRVEVARIVERADRLAAARA
jgi:DNA-binding CsgD family transcriptional regulator/tetratricopeptide (TPR) repeat protein